MGKTQARRIRNLDFCGQEVHFRRADEACDEGIGWTVIKFCRRTDLLNQTGETIAFFCRGNTDVVEGDVEGLG